MAEQTLRSPMLRSEAQPCIRARRAFERMVADTMRVISNKSLLDFAVIHPTSAKPLQAWRKIIESNAFSNYAALKAVFSAVDRVGNFYIFDIGGNKYRVIASIHFNTQKLFVRNVFTHKEYDAWNA